MKSNTSVEITLILTNDEAKWLMDMMQNPLHEQTPEEESAEDSNMRRTFFETIRRDLGHYGY